MLYIAATLKNLHSRLETTILQQNLQKSSVAGPVAQRLEQWTHNPLVVGSNPTGPSCKARLLECVQTSVDSPRGTITFVF